MNEFNDNRQVYSDSITVILFQKKGKLLVVIVPDCMKIWRVLAALKMTVQYLMGSYAGDL